jgi:hypothetical protein
MRPGDGVYLEARHRAGLRRMIQIACRGRYRDHWPDITAVLYAVGMAGDTEAIPLVRRLLKRTQNETVRPVAERCLARLEAAEMWQNKESKATP